MIVTKTFSELAHDNLDVIYDMYCQYAIEHPDNEKRGFDYFIEFMDQKKVKNPNYYKYILGLATIDFYSLYVGAKPISEEIRKILKIINNSSDIEDIIFACTDYPEYEHDLLYAFTNTCYQNKKNIYKNREILKANGKSDMFIKFNLFSDIDEPIYEAQFNESKIEGIENLLISDYIKNRENKSEQYAITMFYNALFELNNDIDRKQFVEILTDIIKTVYSYEKMQECSNQKMSDECIYFIKFVEESCQSKDDLLNSFENEDFCYYYFNKFIEIKLENNNSKLNNEAKQYIKRFEQRINNKKTEDGGDINDVSN